MVIWFINLKEFLENLVLLIILKNIIKSYKSGVQHGYHATVCVPGCKTNHSL